MRPGTLWTALSLSALCQSAISFCIPERFTRVAEVLGARSDAAAESFRESGAHRVRWAGLPSKKQTRGGRAGSFS
jgi:hypothetical protein